MGSSCRVSPANIIPMLCKGHDTGKMVIVNLQKTPLTPVADLAIYATCDKVTEMLMEKLQIPIPDFRRTYRLKLSLSADKKKLLMTGVDSDGGCYSIFKSLKVTGLTQSAASFPSGTSKI